MTELMQVMIRGKLYKSVKTAARAIKVKPCTIYSALHRGTLDTVGLGTGKGRPVTRGGKPKPFTIGPLKFDNLRAASVALGYEKNTLSSILRRRGEKAQGELLRRAMALAAERENAAMRARMDVVAK
jgi:hypothetical protein